MKSIRAIFFCSFFFSAQMFGFAPPTLDPPSWTSGAIGDVPPTKVSIPVDGGGTALGRANLLIAAVSISPSTQKVWFALDSTENIGKVFYNVRTVDPGGAVRWKWARSQELFDLGSVSAQVTDVLYDSSAPFFSNGTNYSYAMYIVNQPLCEPPGVAGLLQVSYSNDGEWWTDPKWVTYAWGNTPTATCGGTEIAAVQVESVGAVFDQSAGKIHLLGIEGNLSLLSDPANMSTTQSYYGFTFTSEPSEIYFQGPVTGAGMLNPVLPGGGSPDFETYHYFMNIAIAYDAGYLYVSRAYPYPFTRIAGSSITPCGSQGYAEPASWCKKSPQTLPNRVQIYRMYIGSLANMGVVQNGTWQLVSDQGHLSGYRNNLSWSCVNSNLVPGQLNASHDFSSASFIRNGLGNLTPEFGRAILAGDSFALSRSQGATCSRTGLERLTHRSF